jgi:hypothetical protein
LPAQFVEPVHGIVVAVNCCNCAHAHLLVAPRTRSVSPMVSPSQVEIRQNRESDPEAHADESMANAVI